MIDDRDDPDPSDDFPPAPVCRDCGSLLGAAPDGAYVDCEGCGACELSRWPDPAYEPTDDDHEAYGRATLASYVSPELLRAHLLATGWLATEVFTFWRGPHERPLVVEFRRAPPNERPPALADFIGLHASHALPPGTRCRGCGAPLARRPAGVYIDCEGCGATELARWSGNAGEAFRISQSFCLPLFLWPALIEHLRDNLLAGGWRGEVRYERARGGGAGAVPLDPGDPRWLSAVVRMLDLAAKHEARPFEAVVADVVGPVDPGGDP